MTDAASFSPDLTGLPFDDVKAVLNHFPDPDQNARDVAQNRLSERATADLPLGRLAELGVWLAGWKATYRPRIERIELALYGSLGASAEADATAQAQQRLTLLAAGGHPVNGLCLRHGVGLKVYDLAIEVLSPNALSEDECAATMAFGMEAIVGEPDLICLSRFGSGGRAAATALTAVLVPALKDQLVGQLTAHDAIWAKAAMDAAAPTSDPFELLRRLGTRDMAAMVGAILAARTQKIPVILDGFVALTSAAVLHAVNPSNIAHCLAATTGGDASGPLAQVLGLQPLVQDSAEGEGVGALLALPYLRNAADTVANIITATEAEPD